jgi:hypothetical protein
LDCNRAGSVVNSTLVCGFPVRRDGHPCRRSA